MDRVIGIDLNFVEALIQQYIVEDELDLEAIERDAFLSMEYLDELDSHNDIQVSYFRI